MSRNSKAGKAAAAAAAAAVAANPLADDEENMTVADLWRRLKPNLDKLETDISDVKESSKASFDSLTATINNLKDDIDERVDGVIERVDGVDDRVGVLEDEIKELKKVIKIQAVDLNFKGQRERKNGMRLNMFPVDQSTIDDGGKLQDKVFSDVLKPIFEAAVADSKCRLSEVPSFLQAIDALHILPLPELKKPPVGSEEAAKQAKRIPSIHIKFRSSEYKRIVCMYKKPALADLNKNGGETHLIDDKTPVNARCMAVLRGIDEVDPMSVQLRNCRVKFCKKGSATRLLVKNPFGSTIDEFTKDKDLK